MGVQKGGVKKIVPQKVVFDPKSSLSDHLDTMLSRLTTIFGQTPLRHSALFDALFLHFVSTNLLPSFIKGIAIKCSCDNYILDVFIVMVSNCMLNLHCFGLDNLYFFFSCIVVMDNFHLGLFH